MGKSMKAPQWSRFEHGDPVKVIQKRPDSVSFPGFVVGWYERMDGWRGYVLQHRYDRIVHVYGEKTVAADTSVGFDELRKKEIEPYQGQENG